MERHQAMVDRLVIELGALSALLHDARQNPELENHPAVARAENALVAAAEALTRFLLSEIPAEVAAAAVQFARGEVEAAASAGDNLH